MDKKPGRLFDTVPQAMSGIVYAAEKKEIAVSAVSYTHLDVYKRQAYHNEELKSLTRYRFDKVKERAKLKSSVARLVNILFPELEKLVSSLHIAVVYALLSNYPGASYIANANTEELAETLCTPPCPFSERAEPLETV